MCPISHRALPSLANPAGYSKGFDMWYLLGALLPVVLVLVMVNSLMGMVGGVL